MRKLFTFLTVMGVAACGAVNDQPLGGPYGGSTDPTDPNSYDPQQDGGTQVLPDSGSPQKDSGVPTKDSSGPPPPVDSGGPTAPTWSQIFTDYLAGSAEGRCAGCHSQGSSASSTYSWLQGRGYISGTSSPLVSSSQSCLSWYGGNMPPSGPNDAKAVADMNAWAAAGALNN